MSRLLFTNVPLLRVLHPLVFSLSSSSRRYHRHKTKCVYSPHFLPIFTHRLSYLAIPYPILLTFSLHIEFVNKKIKVQFKKKSVPQIVIEIHVLDALQVIKSIQWSAAHSFSLYINIFIIILYLVVLCDILCNFYFIFCNLFNLCVYSHMAIRYNNA